MAYDFNFLRYMPAADATNYYGYQGDGGERDQQAIAARQADIDAWKRNSDPASWQEAVRRGYIDDAGNGLNVPRLGTPATPKGTQWAPMSVFQNASNADGSPFKPRLTGNTYDDPVYGRMYQAINPPKQRDWIDVVGPLIAGGIVSGGLGAIGLNPLLSRFLMSIPSLAQGNYGSSFGSILGGATGIPGGSTFGSMVGKQLWPHG